MYREKSIVVVVPCYNEGTQISRVLDTMPEFVDHILVIDDMSKDNTAELVEGYCKTNSRLQLIRHSENQGVGGAIASGYEWARDNDFDVAVVMAGDGQMDPDDLPAVLDPVVGGEVDYSKGNRLFTDQAFQIIPKVRYFGNSVLSLLTKIASGYWHIADSQSGYTAINKAALTAIDWSKMYRRYGQPNDLLVRLNVENFRVGDVRINPVYHIGEQSGIRLHKVIPRVSRLLLKLFFWRLKEKYVIRDFHPLVLFYGLGIFFALLCFLLFVRLFYVWFFLTGLIPKVNALAALFCFASSSQFILFAMWFDMEMNSHLKNADRQ